MRLIKPEFVGIELLWLESKVAAHRLFTCLALVLTLSTVVHILRLENRIKHLSETCPENTQTVIIESGRVKCVIQPIPYGGAALKIRPGWIEEFKINRQKK